MDALAEHDNNQKLKSPEVDTQANNEDELLRSVIRKKNINRKSNYFP